MLLRRLTDASDNQGPWPLDERDAIIEKTWLLAGTAGELHAKQKIVMGPIHHPSKKKKRKRKRKKKRKKE